MVEKVKVTKEQARMIENHKGNFELLMSKRIESNCPTHVDSLSVVEVASAYINGYKIERTPEEEVIYNLEAAVDGMKYTNAEYGAFTDGVLMVLKAYDIKIKGIND